MIMIRIAIMVFSLNLLSCSEGQNNTVIYSPIQCIKSQSSCQILTQFGVLEVKFNVEVIKPETPFSVFVDLKENGPITKNQNYIVSGYLEGKNMYMGKIPLFFSAIDSRNNNKASGGDNLESFNYKADVLLGSCSEEKMAWRMWLTVVDNTGNKETHFIGFISSRI